MTLRRKLVFWYAGVLGVSGFALVVGIYLVSAHQLRREADKFLLDEVTEIGHLYREHDESPAALEQALKDEMSGERYFPLGCRVYDPVARRNVAVAIRPAWSEAFAAPIDPALLDKGPIFWVVTLGKPHQELRLLALRIDSKNPSSLILQGGIYVKRLNRRLALLQRYLASIFGGIMVLAVGGGLFLAGRSLKPIHELARNLKGVGANNLAFRLPASATQDEIGQLCTAINGMLERLDEAFARISDFTADAAHELRTPLAALQCQLEVGFGGARTPDEYRQAANDAMTSANRLTRMVNDLLFLARMDADAGSWPTKPVRLAALIGDVHEVFGILAEQRGIRFEMSCPADCVVKGDHALLRRLIGNLVDNALRHTPTGGSVSLSARSEAGQCLIEVADTGPGIPPEVRERIFDRFFRLEDDRSRQGGAGLGLSICKRAAELHGGAIRVLPRPEGGALFEVRLPAH